ncbi:MAG: PAS domain S-box protein [Anaerolineales bacterium]|nr:PAS domain S-box protein [Anaerolineales bacterium]
MKQFAWLFLILLLVSFQLPFQTGSAASSTGAAFDVNLNFAPGSVVRFEHLTIEDGLSQNAGLVIFQDSRGYLWVGTQDGLNRYDGYEFRVFKHDPDNPNSLSHNSILSLEEDKDGSLWIGTWGGGLNRYDPAMETFTRYQSDSEDPSSLANGTITSIKQDSSGTLWIGTLAGLDRYNPEDGTFEHFRNDPANSDSLSNDAVSVIFEDSNRQLWIGTGGVGVEGSGLNRFDPSTGKFTRYQHDESIPESIASNNIASIVEAPDGTLWIATGGFSLHGNGLDQFDPQTGKARHFKSEPQTEYSLSGDDLMRLWLDPDGVLWIGTWATGLNRMSLSAPGHFTRYQTDPFFPDSLSGDEVWSLYRDRSGVLWVGTSHSGINKLSANAGQFSLYRNNPSNPASLGIDATGAFAEDKHGNIWVATWGGGLDRFNPKAGTFEHYRHDPENPNTLSDDLFMDVYVDSSDMVWAGTLGKGLNYLDPLTGNVTYYLHDPENPASLADDNIAALLPDKKGGLWVGTFGGLSHYDSTTKTFTNYSNDPAAPSSLSHNMVVSLYLDSNNILWIGTWGGGLNQLDLNDPRHSDPKTATFTNYTHNADDPSSLSEDSVWTIHETADGFIWIGTQLGLNRFDPRTGEFKHYTEKNGLPNNVVLGVLEDDDNNLWLTTNNGLARFDPHAETFTSYDISDGLQSNEFNSNAYYRSSDGTMYVGGISGFNLFRPEDIKPNPIPPQVVVTRFDVFNEPLHVDLTGRTPIELNYQQDIISFEFSAFDFQAPQKSRYAYKLEGFDDDWVLAGNRRYVTYTNLPGGDYVFRVKASNSDGVWNETGASLPVSITPPFWQTWWFNGSLIFVLGTLLLGGFRWRLSSIREQNVYLETQITERTSELRETNKLLEVEVEQRKRAEAELAKRAAEELHQSEERFRVMFESAGIGIALVGMDRRPLEANAAMIEMTGYSPEEFFQKTGADLSYSEDANIGIPELKDVLEGKLNTYQIEKRYVRKDGQIYWVRLTNSVVRAPDGKPEYFVTMVEDINEQKHAAEELHKSQARFQAIFDNVAVGVAVMGLDRRPLAFNSTTESIIGYTFDEIKNVDPRSLAMAEDRNIDTELFKELIEGKRNSYVMERRYRHKNGRVFWARINYSLVRDMTGQPDYLVGIIEDIDEQKRAAERMAEQEADYLLNLQKRVQERTQELQEANQLLQKEIEQRAKIEKELAEKAANEAVTADRTRLARDLHDAVTQTLFSASLIAEVLPDLWEMDVEEARNSTEELRQLTRGALAEMRTLLLELRPATLTQTHLSDLIRQLCEAFIGRSRLPIKLNIEGDCELPPEVQVAFYRIAQESLNNVFKYARATQVDVNIFISPSSVHFESCDNGVGFDMSTSKPTSLGMRIMRERAEAIGADFHISSTLGSGTCVEVTWNRDPNLTLRVL